VSNATLKTRILAMPSYRKNKMWQIYAHHVLITASVHRSPFNYKIMA